MRIKIMNLKNIKKTICKTWLWGSRNIFGLYRTLLNDSDYLIFSKQKIVNIKGEKDRKTIYYIERKIA